MAMHTELVSIPTDTVPLDGAWYRPEGGAATGAALLMHGNTMNFYTGPPRFLPPLLAPLGLACLAYNRRGHDVLSTRDSRDLHGGAFQTLAQGIADNRIAAQWLAGQGFPAPIVIGHSNGATLGVRHVADHPETPALVLLSAHAGGPDIARTLSKRGMWAGDRVAEIEQQARDLVAAGRPQELMLLPGWWNVTTAESALDLLAGAPDIVAMAPKISCPVLYLRGDAEPPEHYPGELFAEACAGPCDLEIVENCGHFYVGREDAVAARVVAWLSKFLAEAAGRN